MSLVSVTNDITVYDIWALINGILDPPLCQFCNQEIGVEAPVEDSRYPGFGHAHCLNEHLERSVSCC